MRWKWACRSRVSDRRARMRGNRAFLAIRRGISAIRRASSTILRWLKPVRRAQSRIAAQVQLLSRAMSGRKHWNQSARRSHATFHRGHENNAADAIVSRAQTPTTAAEEGLPPALSMRPDATALTQLRIAWRSSAQTEASSIGSRRVAAEKRPAAAPLNEAGVANRPAIARRSACTVAQAPATAPEGVSAALSGIGSAHLRTSGAR